MDGRDLGQLGGAVVHEDDAIGAEVPGAQDALDGHRLGRPVSLDREQPLAWHEQALGREAGFHRLAVGLARHPDQHAGLGEPGEELLVERVRVALVIEVPRDAGRFAQDAAPERVVEVRDERLLRRRRHEQPDE